MLCDDKPARLRPRQRFKFRAPPNQKATCLVQLYINPVTCTSWTFEDGFTFGQEYQHFTSTYLDPLFDYRLKNKNLAPEINIAKSGLFFIQVGQPHLVYKHYFKNEPSFKVDYSFQLAQPMVAYNYIQPKKMSFS